MPAWFNLILAIVLVIANGFFVAAEFALVKVRVSRVEHLVLRRLCLYKTARCGAECLERSLAACRMGISSTLLSLEVCG